MSRSTWIPAITLGVIPSGAKVRYVGDIRDSKYNLEGQFEGTEEFNGSEIFLKCAYPGKSRMSARMDKWEVLISNANAV